MAGLWKTYLCGCYLFCASTPSTADTASSNKLLYLFANTWKALLLVLPSHHFFDFFPKRRVNEDLPIEQTVSEKMGLESALNNFASISEKLLRIGDEQLSPRPLSLESIFPRDSLQLAMVMDLAFSSHKVPTRTTPELTFHLTVCHPRSRRIQRVLNPPDSFSSSSLRQLSEEQSRGVSPKRAQSVLESLLSGTSEPQGSCEVLTRHNENYPGSVCSISSFGGQILRNRCLDVFTGLAFVSTG
ncbi:hypothetical protein NPIL_201461 [Nephila pilipes]|uniref:Uncharacterized protein n=1 Tax=Nephila pilipes TaxID=299642 RepID=A0A8X6NB98_NEPPI|nr:hypothetical protein NPIL_201461 [Nephila pilipes]